MSVDTWEVRKNLREYKESLSIDPFDNTVKFPETLHRDLTDALNECDSLRTLVGNYRAVLKDAIRA